ncbi:MAG: hypothetical protein KBD62_36015 [Kofleriaceae bacterium]|nr:hypothetical protein [Kofleriaceae bacterium]
MFGFLLALFVCFVVVGCLLAIIVAMGYSLTPDLVKLAEARAWKRQRAELNAAVAARRVRS